MYDKVLLHDESFNYGLVPDCRGISCGTPLLGLGRYLRLRR